MAAVREELILGGEEALDSHGSTSMNTAGGDANLSAKTEPITVSETSRGVPEDRGGVTAVEEVGGNPGWE